MSQFERTDRIGEEIRKHLSDIIRNEIKDPGLSGMTSIMSVAVTKDLRHATVRVSVYGSEEEQQSTMAALTRSAGYIRRRIGEMLRMHYIPQFRFQLDDSIAYSMKINQMLEDIKKEQK